jgi:replicative DNA helicase
MEEIIFNGELEQALLASVIRKPQLFAPLYDIVKPVDFGWDAYGYVWQAMADLQERGMNIDTVVIGDELERRGRLADFCPPGPKQFTGRAALSQLREVHTTESGLNYAENVQDYSAKRQLDRWLTQAHSWTHNGRRATEIMSDLETSFGSLALYGGKVNSHTVPPEVGAIRAIDAARASARGDRAFPTGLIELDKMVGIQRGDLVTLAARPGQGKSALLVTATLNAARLGKRIKFFSVEMSVVSVTQRFLSQISGVNAYRLMQGKLDAAEWEQVETAAEEWSQLPVTICDLPAIRIGQVRTEARREKVDAIILDYVQLAKADGRNDRRDLDIGEVTQGLKAIAKELDIPVLQAAQMNRAQEARSEKKPVLSDLRESGAIENDSDIVIFIYQKSEIDPHELIVAKHRNGPTGSINTYFSKETMRFENCTTRDVLPDYTR